MVSPLLAISPESKRRAFPWARIGTGYEERDEQNRQKADQQKSKSVENNAHGRMTFQFHAQEVPGQRPLNQARHIEVVTNSGSECRNMPTHLVPRHLGLLRKDGKDDGDAYRASQITHQIENTRARWRIRLAQGSKSQGEQQAYRSWC